VTLVPFLTQADRRSVLDKVIGAIDTKFMGPDVDSQELRARHQESVLNAETSEAFETAFNGLLRDLGVSHTGFFHEATPRAAGRIALAATFTKADTSDGQRWVFQDVHPGGVAAAAGIRPGDVLLSVGGNLAAITDGGEYFLFLKKARSPGPGRYEPYYGAVFSIEEGKFKPLLRDGNIVFKDVYNAALPEVVSKIEAAARFR
jgi:hypothetical protein